MFGDWLAQNFSGMYAKTRISGNVALCLVFICSLLMLSCNTRGNSSADSSDFDIVEYDTVVADANYTPPAPSMPSASINKVWTTQFYNTIIFHADFDVNNMQNKTGSFVVYVTKQFTHDKQPINVYWYDTFTPSYENSNYSDFKYTIKKEQLTEDFRFNDETHFKAYIKLYDNADRLLATSEYTSFTIEQY